MISEKQKIERMLQAAKLYYEENMTQSEIARTMGISRPLVSMLLTDARECGIVTIKISNVESVEQLAASQLRERYGLHQVHVVADEAISDMTDDMVAAKAYSLCFTPSMREKRIGVGWGSMIGKMVNYAESMPDAPASKGSLFPLVGGIGASYRSYHSNELVRVLSSKNGHFANYLYFSAFYDSQAELEYVHSLDSYKAVLRNWERMDMALLNISNFLSYPDLGVLTRFDDTEVRKRCVGRVLAHYYDVKGKIIQPKVDNVMQAPIELLVDCRNTVAVCSSLLQPRSVVGALRLRIINTLILPMSLAKQVLEYDKKCV